MLFLIVAAWIFIQTPFGQNYIVHKVTHRLSKDLGTKVEIKHVDFSLFNKMHLEGVFVEDKQKDTLLYAGDLQVRITDWFFFKKNIVLKYIGMKDAVIKLQRTDSVWNHQFIVDYFSSPSSGNKKEGGIALNLKTLEMNNVIFRKNDGWRGEDLYVFFGSLGVDANKIDFSNKIALVNSANISNPVFSIYNYTNRKPKTKKQPDQLLSIDSLLNPKAIGWNADGWIVQLDKLEIKDGLFSTDKRSSFPVLSSFDGNHISFAGINGTFTSVRWEKDTITSHIMLQTKERSGFEVKKLEASLKMTPQEMAFSNLDIQTNNSTIKNFFRMSFGDFSDMDDYIHKVIMQGEFEGSEIDSDDIAFFAPAMSAWKKKIILNGNIRGTVNELMARELTIQAGNNTLLKGDISLSGLPDIEQTFIDFKANDFRTTYEDAVTIIPAIRKVTTPDLRKLEFIRFNGSFTGFTRDFVTFGTIQTNLGTVKSDLNMKLPARQEPVYSGTISSDLFKIGEFIKEKDIGAVALDASLQGKGFSEENRNALIDGDVRFIEFKGYRYSNIAVKGKLDKKLFDGNASIHDQHIEMAMNGEVNFNSALPEFNFIAEVKKADLKNLNLTNDNIAFNGKFKLDFTGSSVDDFLGHASITEASLTRNGNPLPFDSLIISSEYSNNVKVLRARSNEFEGSITGEFNIGDLPDAFRLFLNRYYPAYIKPPKRIPENESFSFDITTQYADEYLKLVDSTLSGFNNSHIYGKLNTVNNELTLNAVVPQFTINKYNFDDVKIEARGNRDSISLSGKATNIKISDSLNIPYASFSISGQNDSSQVTINTGTNQAINKADLNAQVLTYNNGVRIEFHPSTFMVNGKTWTIDEKGELEFRNNVPASGKLVLRESNQEIHASTKLSEMGDWNDLVVELKKVNIGDFSPLLLPKNRLEGLVSGNIIAEDPAGNLHVTSDNVRIEGLRLDNDSLGNIEANVVYNDKLKELKINGNTINQQNGVTVNADIFFDKEKQQNNLIAIKANNFQLKILERFLGDLFSDIQGYVTGNFDIRGELDRPQVTGKGRLKEAGLKVNFTRCFYKIKETDLELTRSEINLDGIVLTDPVTGNPIYIKGGIVHNAFNDMFYDLVVSTRKPGTRGEDNNKPILLLNTTFNDNSQFYGKVKGTGSFSLSGPQSEMFMKIDAIASSRDSSNITIPSSESRETGIADFLVERKYGREMVDNTIDKNASNIIYDVDVTVNRMVIVRVILDDLTGDEIKGRGSGTLNIHSGSNEPLTMRGKFDIEEGDYLFTFQSFFKKPFKLRKGADNYISWDSDPYKAKINFEAVYTAERVSFSPLAAANLIDQSLAKQREDVYVVVHLTGDLFSPNFKFSLDFPPTSITRSDFAVASSIRQIENNENQINRQVTYLIVFNSFAPSENSGGSNSNLSSALGEFTNSTISSLSGMFFNEINKKLNSELSKILKTDNISINFSGYVYNRNLLNNQSGNGIGFNQGNFNLNVPISLFKDRFVVTLGSTLDVPLQASIQQNVQFLPDVTAEWLINQTGTIRASFFYRQDIDYLTSSSTGAARNKRSGGSIAYRREFDTFSEFVTEFFGKRKRQKQPAILPTQDNTDTLKGTTTLPPQQ